jgi:hypothetical protein
LNTSWLLVGVAVVAVLAAVAVRVDFYLRHRLLLLLELH